MMMGDQDLDYPQRPTVSLNDLVPADSFYRQLAERLDLSFVRLVLCYHLNIAERFSGNLRR